MRRFIRRSAVERHQRRRHAGDADDVGAPPILGDERDFDEVRPSRDGFVETMDDGHRYRQDRFVVGKVRLYACANGKQAKRGTKVRAQDSFTRKKNFVVARSTRNAPDVHRISTARIATSTLTRSRGATTLGSSCEIERWRAFSACSSAERLPREPT